MVADWLQSLGSVGSILLGGGGWEGEEILKKCLCQVKIWSSFYQAGMNYFLEGHFDN